MNQDKMVFAQLMEFAPYHVFKYYVKRYDGDYKVQDFTCWSQFLCLKLQKDKLYHLGIGKTFHKSTISRANETRDWKIHRDFALKLKGSIYALDSTIVDLCITTFWWATFRTTKSAIKMHTLLDLKKAGKKSKIHFPLFIFLSAASYETEGVSILIRFII